VIEAITKVDSKAPLKRLTLNYDLLSPLIWYDIIKPFARRQGG
jgi:hypothetical protein